MKTYSALLVVALFALMALSLAGCGGSGPVAPPAGIPSGGTIVTDNPTQTMGFADVQSLARGTGLKVRLNRAGYEVREYPCAYIAAFTDSGMKLVECQMPDNVTIGEGDSGSPVLYNGKTIGGLAYGMDGDHKDFWAKSIEDMTPIAQLANVGGLQLRAIGFSHFCNVSDHVAQVITSLGHGGEQLFANRPTTSLAQIHTCGGVPESAPAIAGQSVSVDFCRGPIVNLCIIGTLTHQQADGKWLCFGHSLDNSGSRNVPVTLATMEQMIDTIIGSSKFAEPTKEPLGAYIQDRRDGGLIDPMATPDTSPITVTGTVGNTTKTFVHNLARDHASWEETSGVGAVIAGSLDVILGQISHLKAQGTVEITFEGGQALTFDVNTPDGIMNTTPTDASSQVTSAVMKHIYDWTGDPANFGKGLESVSVNVTFSPCTAPAPGMG